MARTVIREPLHFVRRSLTSAKPIFHSPHHQISNKVSVDPFDPSHLAHDLSFTAVQGKCDTNLFTLITFNFKAVKTPTDVTLLNRDCVLTFSGVHRPATVAIEQQVVASHRAISPFGANAVNSIVDTLMAQNAPNVSIEVAP